MSNQTTDTRPPSPEGIFIEMLPELTFTRREIGGRSSYVCHLEQKGQFYHFGAAEYEAARLLNGQRSIPEVLHELKRVGVDWSPIELGQFGSMLLKCGLARVRGGDSSSHKASNSTTTSPGSRATHPAQLLLRGMGSLISLRVSLFQADPLAAALSRRLGMLFAPRGVIIWLVLVLSALLIGWENRQELGQQLRHVLAPQSWPWMIVMWSIIKVAHEAGHAIAARRQGVRVGRAGITFFLFAPLAWVNVTDAWRLPHRWARTQIALAGVYVELFIAAFAIWVWWFATGEQTRHLAVQVATLAGPATILVNANPLLRLDGYYALSDWLDIPNLRMHGRRQLQGKLEQLLLGRRPAPSRLEPWRAKAASIHALCSVLFQISWMSGLIIAVSVWAWGLGILLAIAALVMWVVIPLTRWLLNLHKAPDWKVVRWRLATASLLMTGCFAIIASIPSPICRRIPAVVRYQDEQIVRASLDGFVTRIHVAAGQTIQVGDLLLEMDNPDLRLQRDELRSQCEVSSIKARKLRREGNTAMSNAELERLASLRRQVAELERQVESLQVRATRSGIVASYDLDALVNQYVHQGAVLMRIGDDQKKELLISIPGADLDSYLTASAQPTARPLRLRGGVNLEVTLRPPQPRATRAIPHPALAATAGGPLAVEPLENAGESSSERTQLVAPHSISVLPLTPTAARCVQAGQQGIVIIGDARSIWQRLCDQLRNALNVTT